MRKKILVTGGAGFIGSHLCARLAQNPIYEVYSLDNYFTGKTTNHVDNVVYIKGNTIDIAKLVDFKPDIIYHLGEYSRVESSFEDIQLVWQFNKDGTFAVLEFTRRVGAKIIYAGSSTKFSDGLLGCNQSPYAWSKSSNTQLVKNYATWFGINYAITYFYNVYGKGEIQTGKYATVIALFKEKMRTKQPLTVVQPGAQQRNFTHIDDIIDALVPIGENGNGDEYGIGNPKAYTIFEIAQLFGGSIEILPERKGNRMSAEVITYKTQALGWHAKHNIEDYINQLRLNHWQDL